MCMIAENQFDWYSYPICPLSLTKISGYGTLDTSLKDFLFMYFSSWFPLCFDCDQGIEALGISLGFKNLLVFQEMVRNLHLSPA